MKVNNLLIEVTRKCQLTCSHCLRGSRQSININNKYIDIILDKIESIDEITFTGGEPSLNCDAIDHFIKVVKKKGISVGNFYIATNGINPSDRFILSCVNLYALCHDNSVSTVHISNDGYHISSLDKKPNYNKLLSLSFTSLKYRDGEFYDPIAQGRQKYNKSKKPIDWGFNIVDDYVTDDIIYLNALGEIISGCDWSYTNQKKHKVCNVKELSIDKLLSYKV